MLCSVDNVDLPVESCCARCRLGNLLGMVLDLKAIQTNERFGRVNVIVMVPMIPGSGLYQGWTHVRGTVGPGDVIPGMMSSHLCYILVIWREPLMCRTCYASRSLGCCMLRRTTVLQSVAFILLTVDQIRKGPTTLVCIVYAGSPELKSDLSFGSNVDLRFRGRKSDGCAGRMPRLYGLQAQC